MKLIAITGTIASGKSEVCNYIKQRRIPVFDCDGYAHLALLSTQPTYSKIVSAMGEEILDANKEIDRKKLASCIFSDEEKRIALNKIVHPFVKEGMLRYAKRQSEEDVVFVEVPLLFETGWLDLFDAIVVVTCDKEIAIDRMMENRNYSEEEANARYDSQLDPQVQMDQADYIITNNGSWSDLKKATSTMINTYKKRRRSHGINAA